MCIAIPSKIVRIENNTATIEMDGVLRDVSLLLLEDPRVGDYVLVHAGYAIQKMDEATARESLKILREAAHLAETEEG